MVGDDDLDLVNEAQLRHKRKPRVYIESHPHERGGRLTLVAITLTVLPIIFDEVHIVDAIIVAI